MKKIKTRTYTEQEIDNMTDEELGELSERRIWEYEQRKYQEKRDWTDALSEFVFSIAFWCLVGIVLLLLSIMFLF